MKKSVLILICLSLFGFYSCQQERVVNLKIMSYNIRHGEGLDGIQDLSRSAQIIKEHAPDLCGLQEIDHFCSRTDSIGQIDVLARETGMVGTFGKFMDFQGGEYGMATLAAQPLVSTKILQLPDGKYEPRTAIVHEVELAEGCTIAFANVHFDWVNEEGGSSNRLEQAKALVQYLDGINRASVITGDFNCTPDSPTMQYFAEQGFVFMEKGEDHLSFQGENQVEIDHVIYRNMEHIQFNKKSIQLLQEPVVSDHRPLVAQLEVVY